MSNPLERLSFRPRTSMDGSRRRSRCVSPGNVSRRESEAIGSGRCTSDAPALDATVDEVSVQPRLVGQRTQSSAAPIKPTPKPLGQVSGAAAALLAEDLHDSESLIARIIAGEGNQRDTDLQPLRTSASPGDFATAQSLRGNYHPPVYAPPARSLLARRSIGASAMILLLPVIIVLMNLRVSEFWNGQADDHTFELASSSSDLIKNALGQRNHLGARLVAHHSRGITGEPARLGLTLRGWADGAVVLIAGLIPGMTLSSGHAVGADSWQLPAADLGDTWLGPPLKFVGVVELVAELRLPDATIADRQSIYVEWIAASHAGAEQVSGPAASDQVAIAADPAGQEQVSGPVAPEPVPVTASPADSAGQEQISGPVAPEPVPVAASPADSAGQEQISDPVAPEPVPVTASPAGPEQISSPAALEQMALATSHAGPEPVSSLTATDPVRITAGSAPEPSSVPERSAKAVLVPPLLDQHQIATEGGENPPTDYEQGIARNLEKRAAKDQGTGPARNKASANAFAARRASLHPLYAGRQLTDAKWELILHCWSVGKLVGSSSASATFCR